jgi:DNA-binding MarR family transcriptional regulator
MAPRSPSAADGPAEGALDAGLRQFAGYHMRRAMAAIQADVNATLAPFGLRMVPFSVLVTIADNPGVRPSQLAGALAMERSNLAPILDSLARDGLILREPAPEDRRAHALSPSPQGARLAARARAAVEAHDARMTGHVDPDMRRRLIGILNEIEARGQRSD